jgi:spore germination cell wall hydrolase CwlJ-like protein
MTPDIALFRRPLWRTYPRETLVLGMLAGAAALAAAGAAYSAPTIPGLRGGDTSPAASDAPLAPPPLLVRQLAPETAQSINQEIPLAAGPNPAASPFIVKPGKDQTYARALECLSFAVYYEAGQEPTSGQQAVAQVVLNRVRNVAFPASVCEVVYQGSTRVTGCQFTFTCDGSLARRPMLSAWNRASAVARAALAGAVHAPVGLATHYHADYVVPYWASSLIKNAVEGRHIFYRWAGGWGRAPSFAKRYAGREPDTLALRTAAMAAEAAEQSARAQAQAVPETEVAEAVAEIPGAEVKAPEKGRVGVRFNLAAREAVEKALHSDYEDEFKASDNLRWSLSNSAVEADDKPLGRAPEAPAKPASGGVE